MPIAHVASSGEIAGLTPGTTTAIDTTGANFLVCTVGFYRLAIPSISDSYGNTWTPLTQYEEVSFSTAGQIFYVENATCGVGHTFTIGNVIAGSARFSAFSGVNQFDQESGFGHDALNFATTGPGAFTPSEDGCLIAVGFAVNHNGIAPGTPDGSIFVGGTASLGGSYYGSGGGYRIQTTAGSVNQLWTGITASPGATMQASFTSLPEASEADPGVFGAVATVLDPTLLLFSVPGLIAVLVVLPSIDIFIDEPQQDGNYYRLIPRADTPILDVRVSEIRYVLGQAIEVIDI